MKPLLQRLETYDDARKLITAFVRPAGLNFVVIVAPPGVGKTNTLFKGNCENVKLFQGALSPVKLYCELYRHRNKPTCFDDVDEIWDTRAGVNLFKCLGQTDKTKTLMWEKASSVLREEGVPNEFETSSRALVFANTLKAVEENLGAVLDRAHLYRFDPPPVEIHREVGHWFHEKEIYDFVGANLAQIETLSMRDYVKAKELKSAKLNWREMLLHKWHKDPKLAKMLSLVQDREFTSSQRQMEFERLGLGAEATYKRYLARANKIVRTQFAC